MVTPVTISNLTVSGRAQANDPALENVFITYNADFDNPASYELDFTIVNQQQLFGVPQSLFLDNGSNPNNVEVYVTNTDQFFIIPAYASGVWTINAINGSRIRFESQGGATDLVTITIYNHKVAPVVWYSNGNLGPGSSIDVTVLNTPLDVSVGNVVDVDIQNASIAVTGAFYPATQPVSIAATVPVSIAATVNVAPTGGAWTDRSIANLSGASQQLMAANANRKYLFIQNVASNNMGVNLAGGAAAIGTAGTITLIPGASIELVGYASTAQINIIGTANDDVTAYEG